MSKIRKPRVIIPLYELERLSITVVVRSLFKSGKDPDASLICKEDPSMWVCADSPAKALRMYADILEMRDVAKT